MADFPAMPLWTDSYLADTRHLTAQEHGAYLLLLMTAWRTPDCCLPNDDKLLARYSCVTPRIWKRIKPTILDFFILEDERFYQKRLTKERQFVTEKSNTARRNVGARWLKTNETTDTDVIPTVYQTDTPTPTPTPTPIKKERKKNGKPYVFEGECVRLNQADYDAWKGRFSNIPDFNSELQKIDDWHRGKTDAERRGWFGRASTWLDKSNEENKSDDDLFVNRSTSYQ